MSEQRGETPRNFKIVRASTITVLEGLVSSMRENGWNVAPSLFFDQATLQWCQPMTRKPDTPSGEGTDIVRLREPKGKTKLAGPQDCHFSVG